MTDLREKLEAQMLRHLEKANAVVAGIALYGYGQVRRTAEQHARELRDTLAEITRAPVAAPTGDALGEAARDVLAERKRQVDQEGYSPEHDDEHADDHYLVRAAACYALAGAGGGSGPFWITHLQTPQQVWPYRWEWKPSDNRRNLVKAAALLLAEIERIDRASLTGKAAT